MILFNQRQLIAGFRSRISCFYTARAVLNVTGLVLTLSHGTFPEVPSRKSSILLTISCDKHWDMLLVVLRIWLWGGLDIL